MNCLIIKKKRKNLKKVPAEGKKRKKEQNAIRLNAR